MEPMYLKEIEAKPVEGMLVSMMERMQTEGRTIPQIWHLFGFKPDMTRHLANFTQEVMRGPSPLPAGMRELIAAFTSTRNQCPF